MKRYSLLFFVIILASCSANMPFAENSLADYRHYGYIIDASGQKIDGLIELNAFGDIWFNQGKIGFSPQSEIDKAKAAGKTKIRPKWYSSSELNGYGYDNKKFVTKRIELTTGVKLRMLEVISEQQKTYKFYSSDDKPSDPNKYSVMRENSKGELERIK